MEKVLNTSIKRFFLKSYAKFLYKYFNKSIKLKSVYNINLLFNDDSTFSYSLDGAYSNLIIEQIKKLNKGDLFIDIGANQGLFSILSSKAGAKVLSFEPSSSIFSIFLKNLDINRCKNIYPMNLAVFNELTEKCLFTYDKKSGKSYVTDNNNNNNNNILTVNRDFFKIIKNIEFNNCIIKIDVEGSEYIVLRELENIIISDNRISTIIVEINSKQLKRFSSKKETLYQFFERNNFTPLRKKTSEHYDEVFKRIKYPLI